MQQAIKVQRENRFLLLLIFFWFLNISSIWL